MLAGDVPQNYLWHVCVELTADAVSFVHCAFKSTFVIIGQVKLLNNFVTFIRFLIFNRYCRCSHNSYCRARSRRTSSLKDYRKIHLVILFVSVLCVTHFPLLCPCVLSARTYSSWQLAADCSAAVVLEELCHCCQRGVNVHEFIIYSTLMCLAPSYILSGGK